MFLKECVYVSVFFIKAEDQKKKKFRGIEDNEIRQKCSKLKKVAET